MPSKNLRILLVAAEVAPFAKVGGLADVAGALPKALKSLGHDVRVIMPAYRMVVDDPRWNVRELVPPFPVDISYGWTENASILQTSLDGDVPVYLIKSDRFFNDATESSKVYSLDPWPYVYFARAVAESVLHLPRRWSPDILHCNDWHTGLAPVYVDTFYRDSPAWSGAGRVYTIHNMAYLGDFDYATMYSAGLPDSLFTYDRLEYFGKMSFMKGGLVYSHQSNTVSETYAREIQTAEGGYGLDGLLRHLAHQGRLSGIVNGLDYEVYNPATDPRIAAPYDAGDIAGKAKCKRALQEECGLAAVGGAPLFGIVSRLTDQKGFDLIECVADRLIQNGGQIVVLGAGDPRYEGFFRALEQRHPDRAKAVIGFDASLAQRIYAGCDLFLMPSRFEPCGLGQLMSLRYGTIPVVRATGGLADTIADYWPGTGTGFVFNDYHPEALWWAIGRALEAYGNKPEWKGLVDRAMRADFSWARSADSYEALYRRALAAARPARAA